MDGSYTPGFETWPKKVSRDAEISEPHQAPMDRDAWISEPYQPPISRDVADYRPAQVGRDPWLVQPYQAAVPPYYQQPVVPQAVLPQTYMPQVMPQVMPVMMPFMMPPPRPMFDRIPPKEKKVVTKQPRTLAYIPDWAKEREWSTGLCDCCSDCKVCCCVTVCPQCYLFYLSYKMNETICMPCFIPLPLSLIMLRIKIRNANRIEGTICEDCLVFFCCLLTMCAYCQLAREHFIQKKKRIEMTEEYDKNMGGIAYG